jgi:hypothetical protein
VKHKEPDLGSRTFILRAGFLGAALAGWWLGLLAALIHGVVPASPPLFPGEYLLANLVASAALGALVVLVSHADPGARTAPVLLATASFAAINTVCALHLLTPPETLCVLSQGEPLPWQCLPSPPPPNSLKLAAMAPTTFVTVLLCTATVRRSSVLRLVGFAAAALFVLAGLLLSLARALA